MIIILNAALNSPFISKKGLPLVKKTLKSDDRHHNIRFDINIIMGRVTKISEVSSFLNTPYSCGDIIFFKILINNF